MTETQGSTTHEHGPDLRARAHEHTHTTARLMAAAPELLEALQGVVRSAGYESGEAEPSLCELNVSISSLDQARAAIEKVVDSRVSGAAK